MNPFPMRDTRFRKSRGSAAAVGALAAVVCLGALSAPRADPSPVPPAPLAAPVPVSAPAVKGEPGSASGVPAAAGGASPAAGPGEGPRQALSAPLPPDKPTATGSAPGADDRRPRDGLDTELVYAVLVAEVAARHGDLALAFTQYLHAARLARDPKMAELALRAAVSAGDDAGAARAVALWLEIAPESLGALQGAAFLRIKAGDRAGALTYLARVIGLAGTDTESGYLQAASIVERAASPDARLGLMRELVARDASTPAAQQALAMVAAGAEQYEAAAAAARRALELRPNWDKPSLLLVRLLLLQGKREEARALIEQFIAANPENQGLRLLVAQLLLEEKDYAGARAAFERLLVDRPKDPDALFAAGVLALELGDLEVARSRLTRLYQSGERQDEASFYLGQVEERAEHPATAIDWYAKTQGSNLLDAQVRTAVLRAKSGEVERAREILQQLRDQTPDDAPTLFLAEAEILDHAGRQEAAMQVYAEALVAFPDDTDLLYGRAIYAVKYERIAQAEQDLRRIVERNPDHADALNALGYTLADRTDRYSEALGYIERAYRLKPEEPAILDSMGWVNYKLGRPEAALEFLRRANAAMKDAEIAAHLGEVLWALGRQDEARAVWDAALKEHPEHAYLRQVVAGHPAPDAADTRPAAPQAVPSAVPQTTPPTAPPAPSATPSAAPPDTGSKTRP